MRIFFPAIVALLTSGCITSEPPLTAADYITVNYGSERNHYIRCNVNSSRIVASQPGDPISLAIAARAMCLRAETTLSEAIFAVHHPELARKLIEQTRQFAVEANASTIVKARALRQ